MKERLTQAFAKFCNMGPRDKALIAVGSASWAIRTALWPIAGIHLYNETKAMGLDLSFRTFLENPALREKFSYYMAAWTFLKITQWTTLPYTTYAYYKAPVTKAGPEGP